MKSKGMTLKEHQAVGRQLDGMTGRIIVIEQFLASRYGKSKKATKAAAKVRAALQHLRVELAELARGHTNEPGSIYFGGTN